MDLGENLKKARKAAGINQGDLAKLLGTNQKDISRWENNLQIPNALTLAKTCEILKVSADEILELTPTRKVENLSDDLGANLKAARTQASITQVAVAKELGVLAKDVWRWEANVQAPGALTFARICQIIGASSDEILGVK